MAIAPRGAAVVPTGNPTTGFTVTAPSQVVTDDVLFLSLTSRDSTGAGTLSVTDNDTGGNAWAKIGNSTDHKITLWYKRATSGTASKTVTVANAVGSTAGVLKAFSGATATETPYTNVVVETNASGDEAHAAFTPANPNSMVCAAVANYANDNAVSTLAFATLGSTTATEKLSTGGSDCGNIFGHALQAGAAADTGALSWAQTNGATYSMTWAIKAAATVVEADLSAAGAGAMALVGAVLWLSTLSAAGSALPTFEGEDGAGAVLASAGAATVTWGASNIVPATVSSSGVAAMSAAAAVVKPGEVASAGTSSVTMIGGAIGSVVATVVSLAAVVWEAPYTSEPGKFLSSLWRGGTRRR